MPVFTKPATRPFHMAICEGSLPEILRVRLLSIPQQRQAAVINSAPWESVNPPSCGNESKMLPKTINAKPAPTRLSTFSRKTIQAIAAVATDSKLSKREAVLAETVISPSNKSAGPATPPARMAPASQGRSTRERGVSTGFTGTNPSHDGEADTRAEIEQTRNEQRMGRRKGEFCQRSARAEKQRRAKRDQNAMVPAHSFPKSTILASADFVEAGHKVRLRFIAFATNNKRDLVRPVTSARQRAAADRRGGAR